MKIKTKFDIGDKIYRIHETDFEHMWCPECDGEGEIKLKTDKIWTCPECNGEKKLVKDIPKQWRLWDDRIEYPYDHTYGLEVTEIKIDIWENGRCEIDYFFRNGHSWSEDDDLFATEEEALKACDIKNQETIERELRFKQHLKEWKGMYD